jgi:hypothetical protein
MFNCKLVQDVYCDLSFLKLCSLRSYLPKNVEQDRIIAVPSVLRGVLWRDVMTRELVDDELWEMVCPPLPAPPSHWMPADRKRLDERRIITRTAFILQSGMPWEIQLQLVSRSFVRSAYVM